jgi:hypothetical protein
MIDPRKLETSLIEEIARDVGICVQRAYVLMNIPVHEDRKILSLHPCYAN